MLSEKWGAAAASAVEKKEKVVKVVPTNVVGFLGQVAMENLALAKEGKAELRLSYGAFTALLVKEGTLPPQCAKVAQSSIELVNALPAEYEIKDGDTVVKANLQALIVDRNGKCAKWPVPAKIALIKDGTALVGIYTDYVASIPKA